MKNLDKSTLLLFLLYTVSQGGILFISNAIYWDDWVFFNKEPSELFDFFKDWGSMFNLHGYLYSELFKIGPWIFRFLTFVLFFSCGILLKGILEHYKFINKNTTFLIVLLFLILPFNLARVAIANFHYTLCLFLFFSAWRMLNTNRLPAIFLFFLSFNTNSLLVFYAIPILEFIYKREHFLVKINVFKIIKRYFDLLSLPIIYFTIKNYFYSPTGLYQGYNQNFSFFYLITSPFHQFIDLSLLTVNVFLLLLFTLIIFLVLKRCLTFPKVNLFYSKKIILVGFFCFIFGIFPYWILGHVATFYDWGSRHQILLPLGSSLLIIGSILYYRAGLIIFCFVAGISLALSISAYKDLYVDWQKQKKIISFISSNNSINQYDLILFDDRTTSINALHRVYRYYEWNGMLKLVFKNENHFAINYNEYPRFLRGEFGSEYFVSQNNAANFKNSPNLSILLIEINFVRPESILQRLTNKLYPEFDITLNKI